MNFSTKVLSRFVRTSGLRLQVEFAVDPSAEVTDSMVEATRIALRELGLSEQLE